MKSLAFVLALAAAAAEPATELKAQGQALVAALEKSGAVTKQAVVWQGVEYRRRGAWELCPPWYGVCFPVSGKGAEALVLAAAGPEPSGFEKVNEERYSKVMSQEAIALMRKSGVIMADVFTLRSAGGERLFDARGRLNAAGSAAFQTALATDAVGWRLPTEAELEAEGKAAAGANWGDPEAAAARIRELKRGGWFEVDGVEMKCLKEWDFSDEELQTVNVRDRLATRTFVHDDPLMTVSMILGRLKETKKCRTGGMIIRQRGANE